MTATFRLTESAREDIASILLWSYEQFGEQAQKRYEALIVAAIRDAATASDDPGLVERPELGDGVVSWHLSNSRYRSSGGRVNRPRHFLICRIDAGVLVVGRVLHDAMDVGQHVDPAHVWS